MLELKESTTMPEKSNFFFLFLFFSYFSGSIYIPTLAPLSSQSPLPFSSEKEEGPLQVPTHLST